MKRWSIGCVTSLAVLSFGVQARPAVKGPSCQSLRLPRGVRALNAQERRSFEYCERPLRADVV